MYVCALTCLLGCVLTRACATANLPGSTVDRQLLKSFSRMLPGAQNSTGSLVACRFFPLTHAHARPPAYDTELLRYSSASELLAKIPTELQEHHRLKKRDPQTPALPVTVARRLGRAGKHLATPRPPQAPLQRQASIWDGWEDALSEGANAVHSDEETGDLDLDALGL